MALRFLLGFVVIGLASQAMTQDDGKSIGEPAKKGEPPAEVEVRFVDGSTVKVQVRDAKIELATEYGKLLIPVADIKRIDFGQRIPEETRKRVEAAIANLGSAEWKLREAATSLLLKLKDNAYPALVKAKEKVKDPEAERRIRDLIEKIQEVCPADALDVPPHDIIHTAHSRIAGHITVDTMQVKTLPFGDQAVKLADMRTLRSGGFGDAEPAALAAGVLPDPGTLRMYANQVGQTLSFRVTAPPAQLGGQMGVWGTDVYTTDSSLAGAAVHAGVLRPGETGVVRVTMVGQQAGFQATVRNGVMSNQNGPYPGFRIEQPKGGQPKGKK